MHLVLLSRPDCHLCEHMKAMLATELPRLGATWEVRNVDDDPRMRQRFGDFVPVLLREGRPVAKVRTSPDALRRIVTRRR